ncbi:MAG: trypsin-like peptidase domain-containing protein [Actinomycetota bacterium]|nr:trypsin-like peptidase domain-containing protein [Actinomycetota bacterium]
MPYALRESMTSGTAMERAGRKRFLASAGLAIALFTAGGCTGAGADGFSQPSIGRSAGQSLEQDFTRVVKESLPSIVEITSPSGIGSGVILDDKGNIVTNAHVVGTSTEFQVRTSTGTQQFPATLVGSYPPEDLAVIRVHGAPSLKPARFGRSSALEVGDIVLAMGNPFGLEATVTEGLISKLGRTVQEPAEGDQPGALLRSAIQTSAPINPGNSGGALVNLNSEVIGIPTLAAVNPVVGGTAPGIGFAIPSDTVTDIAGQLITHGRVVNSRRAALGVVITTVTDLSGKPIGVGISGLVPGGPASNAGLQNGDVIIKVGDQPVVTAQQLQEVLATHKPNEKVEIVFIRPPGEATTVPVTLGELPAS